MKKKTRWIAGVLAGLLILNTPAGGTVPAAAAETWETAGTQEDTEIIIEEDAEESEILNEDSPDDSWQTETGDTIAEVPETIYATADGPAAAETIYATADEPDAEISLAAVTAKVKITFHPNGGTGTRPAQTILANTASVLQANDPGHSNGYKLNGYIFAGWNTKRDGSGTFVQDGGVLLTGKDMTLYAMWVKGISTCSVAFHANGGAEADYARTLSSGSGTLEKGAFTRKNYTFAGWNTSADGKGTSIADGAAVSRIFSLKKSSVQLYAQWSPQKYSISYVLNGGTNSTANPSSYYYEQTIKPSAPERKGYLFTGWYKDKSLKNKVTAITEGNTVLYAGWKPITYTVKFAANGGSGTTKAMTSRTYDKSYTLTANAFTRSGYAFAGWNTAANGKGKTYKNKASVKNLSSVNKGTVTLYAQWNRIYRITYACNGGSVAKSARKKFTVATGSFTLPSAKRTGYTFKGWYKEKTLKTKVTTQTKGSTGNRTYYAKWKANTYKVRFSGNGSGSGNMNKWQNKTYTYGKTFTLPAGRYKKSGYTFNGWNTKADGTGKAYSDKASVKNLTSVKGGTVILYAQWKPNKTLIPLRTEEGYRAGNVNGTYASGAFANNGCGPSACAIISGEHPLSVGAWMEAAGEVGYGPGGRGGTNPTGITRYFQAHGISVGRPGTYQEWYNLMATGQYYGICLMTSASPYTSASHYIVVSDVSPTYGCYVYDATWSARDGWSGQRYGVYSFDGMSSAWWVIPKYR